MGLSRAARPGKSEQLAGIHTSRSVRCAAELRRWLQALGAWFVQTILDESERLLAGVDLMNRLGRRDAVERLAERPRERRTTLEGLVLGERTRRDARKLVKPSI